jgi:drug/metabolite transporter (DMT)-like permease
MDLPILIFAGSLWLLVSYAAAGATGLIFPGFAGWIMMLVALVRAVVILSRGLSFRPPSVSRRQYAAIWSIFISTFLLLIVAVLIVDHMPQTWKDAIVKALHVRRVYRNYGSP